MKKIFIIWFLSLFLYSCGSVSNDSIEKAKKDALNWVTDKTIEIWKNTQTWSLKEEKQEENISKNISYKYLTDEKLVRVDTLDINDFSNLEKEITWITLWHVDKIEVSYKNSSWASEKFTLKKFKAWDSSFMFRAFKKYWTFDYWENIYIISAYSWEKISKLELIVNLEKNSLENPENTKTWSENILEKKEIKVSELPKNTTFWNPVELWNWKITYSDIKGLEIEKNLTFDLKNEENSVTSFLSSRYKNIFYWNTKRVIWEDWISFFVVRLDWNNYFYEKHYYKNWYYGVLSLEKWDFDSSLPIEEKTKKVSELNTILREKNSSYPLVNISDGLFKSF